MSAPDTVKCPTCGGDGKVLMMGAAGLKGLREGAGVTSVTEAAERVGLSASYIYDLEKGNRRVTEKVIQLYMEAFGERNTGE